MARRGSSAWTLEHYGKACTKADLVDLEWYPGQVDTVHKGTELIWRAVGAIMLAYNYPVRDRDTGFYNCRPITGGTAMSNHAYPTAGDINWKTNPYINHKPFIRTIKWGIETDMPAAMIREIEQITASGIKACKWGGRYRTIKDAMHIELLVTLGEIAGGVFAPREFYTGEDELAILSEEAQKFFEEVFKSLGSPPLDQNPPTPLKPSSNEDFAKVLVEDFRARKAAGETVKHTHKATTTVGGSE